MAEMLDKDGRPMVIGRVTKKLHKGDQVPGMPGAIATPAALAIAVVMRIALTINPTRLASGRSSIQSEGRGAKL